MIITRRRKGKQCECGCGRLVTRSKVKPYDWNRFIYGHSRKNKHFSSSIEVNNKISCSVKKLWENTEYRNHMVEVHKGKNCGEKHPMYGKHHSEESNEKNRQAHLGKQGSMTDRHHTEKSKKQMSESHTGVPLAEEHKKNIGLAQIGRVGPMKGKTSPMKGRRHTKEANEKNRKSQLKLWENPEHVRKCLVFNSPNKTELKLESILDKLYLGEYKFVGNGQVVIDGKTPDFINVNGQKKIIELWGDYWHKDQNPQDRMDIFTPYGYKTLVIWERELKNFQRLKAKIVNFNEV